MTLWFCEFCKYHSAGEIYAILVLCNIKLLHAEDSLDMSSLPTCSAAPRTFIDIPRGCRGSKTNPERFAIDGIFEATPPSETSRHSLTYSLDPLPKLETLNGFRSSN